MLCAVPRSHLCIACGHDLTHLRAPPDPHYSLPVVVCPGCATACVRRPYAGAARCRSAGRLSRVWLRISTTTLGFLVLGLGLVIPCVFIVGVLNNTLDGKPLHSLLHLDPKAAARLAEGAVALPICALLAALAGAAGALALPHWPPRRFAPALLLAGGAFLLLPQLLFTPTEWAAGTRPLGAVIASNAPEPRDLLLFLVPFTAALGLQAATATLTRRTLGARRRGLGSRRLSVARRRRRRLQ